MRARDEGAPWTTATSNDQAAETCRHDAPHRFDPAYQ